MAYKPKHIKKLRVSRSLHERWQQFIGLAKIHGMEYHEYMEAVLLAALEREMAGIAQKQGKIE